MYKRGSTRSGLYTAIVIIFVVILIIILYKILQERIVGGIFAGI